MSLGIGRGCHAGLKGFVRQATLSVAVFKGTAILGEDVLRPTFVQQRVRGTVITSRILLRPLAWSGEDN